MLLLVEYNEFGRWYGYYALGTVILKKHYGLAEIHYRYSLAVLMTLAAFIVKRDAGYLTEYNKVVLSLEYEGRSMLLSRAVEIGGVTTKTEYFGPYEVVDGVLKAVYFDGGYFDAEGKIGIQSTKSQAVDYARAFGEIMIMHASDQLFHLSAISPLGNRGATIYDSDIDAVTFMIPGGVF